MMCEPSQMKLSEAIALELGATPISATPSWTENKHATFKEAIKIGAQATASLCDDFAEVLPFPGGAVTALLGQVAKLVSSAMANHDNLLVLQNVAAELMDVIIEKHVSKVVQTANQGGSRAAKAGSRMYYQLMARFRDLLDEILTYAKDYNNKTFIVKLLMTGHCRERYQELVDNLAKLLASAHFSVSLDTHSMVTDVQNMSVDTHSMVTDVQSMTAEMRGMVEDIRSRAKYTDRSSEVKHIVDELGGYNAVANSDAKLDKVVQHLDSGQQIEIAVLKKQARAGLMALEAAQQEGVHSLVKHTDMRTFWRKCFKGLPKVDWEVWWEAFPSQLMVVVQDKAVVEQVTARLSTEAELRRFQKFVGKDDNATISVKEVNDTFPSYMSIPKAVDRALGLQEDGVSEATATSGMAETNVFHPESLAPQQRVSGPDHPSSIALVNNHAACQESQGKEEPKASQDALAMYSKQGQVAQGQQSSMQCQPEATKLLQAQSAASEANLRLTPAATTAAEHKIAEAAQQRQEMARKVQRAEQEETANAARSPQPLKQQQQQQQQQQQAVPPTQLLSSPTWSTTLQKVEDPINSVAFTRDGSMLVSAVVGYGEDGNTIKLWDLASGNCTASFRGHSEWVHSIAISRDGRMMVSGSHDKTVRLWDLGSQKCTATLTGHTDAVQCVAISPDGATIASTAWDGTVRLWNARTGSLEITLSGDYGGLLCVAFNLDGTHLATGGYDQTVRVWDLRSKRSIAELHGHSGAVPSVIFSQDGATVLSGSHDKTIKVWDVRSKKCERTLKGHKDAVLTLALTADGQRAVSGSGENFFKADTTIKIWDWRSSGECLATLKGHKDNVSSVAVSPDGKTLASGSTDRTIRLWKLPC